MVCHIGEPITKRRLEKKRKRWEQILEKRMSVACFNNKDQMVGVVLLYIGKKIGSESKRGEPTVILLENI